jgi:hypothetical protein
MPHTHEFASLMDWCRSAPLETGTSVIAEDYWGFYAENMATGTTWFAWFTTRNAMLLYFRDCWGFNYHVAPEALEEDTSLMLKAARYGVVVARYEAGNIDEDLFLSLLSDVHPDVTVHWIGTLEDMLDGDTAFARAWRADFRGMDLKDGDYPIEDDEMDDVLRAMAWS